MSQKIERRLITAHLRMADDDGIDDDGIVCGYAAIHYNGNKATQSQDLGGFRERLMPGCFNSAVTRALASPNDDCKCLFNHDASLILGRTGNKTLDISSDTTGLMFRCQLGKQSYAQDLRESIRTGLVNQCSFGFIMDDDPDSEMWDEDQDEDTGDRYRVRNIRKVGALLDVSPVTYPAYTATACAARNLWPDGEPATVLRAMRQRSKEAELSFARSQRRSLVNRVIGL